MDPDSSAWKVLALLRFRITIVIGDNLDRLARGLDLSPEDFTRASERLLSLGLAEEESLGEGYQRLAITDMGIARHDEFLQLNHRSDSRQPTPESKAIVPGPECENRVSEFKPSLWHFITRLPMLAYRCRRWHSLRGGWLRDYLRRSRSHADHEPIDVMVLVTDHFEPARSKGHEAATESVRTWCESYEQLAARHHDADGRPPQHTWFFRFDYPNADCLQHLSASVFRGFGEVEFHLHHGHDTEGSFAATLRAGLDWFNRFGAMLTAETTPQQRFGYIAGNWSLDNGSGNDAVSGCDTEIRALRDAGCYADFTFPALGSQAQPRLVNRIYYAREDGRPKSYNDGIEAAVGREATGDLLIFQGPTAIDWRSGRVDDAAVEKADALDPRRLPVWLSPRVHVAGRPEWVFVKLHTHAMQNRAAFLGPNCDALLTAMERHWNRPPFRLHYVTAREAYNIVKAAEDGHSGNAGDYRDYCIPRPANRLICCDVPWRLLQYTAQEVRLEVLASRPAHVEFAGLPLERISGRVRHIQASFRQGELESLRVDGDGPVVVAPARYQKLVYPSASLSA
jgi:hypothetical protein